MKLHAHQHIDPLDPRELNPSIPDGLASVLAHMMAKDRNRRYSTPGELIADLKAIGEQLRISSQDASADSSIRAIPANRQILHPRFSLSISTVLASAAVLMAALAIFYSGKFVSVAGRNTNSGVTATKSTPVTPAESQTPTTAFSQRLLPNTDE